MEKILNGESMKARAAALFDALDADGSGEIDDEEFIEGLKDFHKFAYF